MTEVFGKVRNIHFIGIGGIGMSGLAEILHSMGFKITGSDIADSANCKRLRAMGIKVFVGHLAENAVGADAVVYSSAVRSSNPELIYARENFVPVIKRGEMLAELMRMKYSIAIAGSHGKTTTTSMVAEIFNKAELDPTVVVGGILNRRDSNALKGNSNIMIAEADESDKSFLMLQPTVAVITNIDFEHTDTYATMDEVKDSFRDFASRVPFYGLNVLCLDDANTAELIKRIDRRFVTYGLSAQADVHSADIEKHGFAVSFGVVIHGKNMGRINLNFPGEHNVQNALAAIAVATEFDIPFRVCKKALEEFEGVQRRLTVRYDSNCCTVLDDYGHHPTEIKTTLKAIREAYGSRRIVVVFQPHRYSRTQTLMNEFSRCFFDADRLFITDIYAASEEPIEGITAQALVKEIKERGFKDVHYLPSFDDIYRYLEESGCDNSLILTQGAGSITRFSGELSAWLEQKHEK
ncbi:MAG: UDP-N-acetylmuramate--L-alanine ligase [Geovibrio sp.]|nr:UDP-N-acetylmuramate--L-alanine ligase [Geovibrio sp.]